MRIVSLRPLRFSSRLKQPFITALRRVDTLEDIVVQIVTDNDTVGLGEAAPTPQITGDDFDAIYTSIQTIAPYLIGQDPLKDFSRLLKLIEQFPIALSAKSAVDTALWDLHAKLNRRPLCASFGSTPLNKTLQTDVTLSIGGFDTLYETANDYYRNGFRHFKIKLGKDTFSELEKVVLFAKEMPDDIELRLDANQSWQVDKTIEGMRKLESCGLRPACLEQPLPADEINGMKMIKKAIATPLLADESAFDYHRTRMLLQTEACDMINIKLAKCGGITAAKKIIELCRDFNVTCMMGCMMEGPVAIAAASHLACAYNETVALIDLDPPTLLQNPSFEGSLRFENNRIVLEDVASGLGIDTIRTSPLP